MNNGIKTLTPQHLGSIIAQFVSNPGVRSFMKRDSKQYWQDPDGYLLNGC